MSHQITHVNATIIGSQQYGTGYAMHLEDYQGIEDTSSVAKAYWQESFKEYEWEPPAEIDPREWFDIEDQKKSNSCVGNSLADCGEYVNLLSEGKEVQLSRYFAYLASQDYGNMLGSDSGAYMQASTKAAAAGLPLESRFPFSTNYRSQLSKYRSEKSAILSEGVYKFPTAITIRGAEEAYRFLSGWTGAIHIGIGWSLSNTWEHKTYRPGGGGHAVLICGYLKVSGWPMGIGFLLKNSWNTSWGRNGWGLIHPNAIDQMFSSRGNVAIGRSDMTAPTPRVERVERARSATTQKRRRIETK